MSFFTVDLAKQKAVEHTVPSNTQHTIVEYIAQAKDTITHKTKIVLAKGARLSYVFVVLAGMDVRKHLLVELAGEGAYAHVSGVVLGSGTNHLHLTSVTLHSAPYTKARVNVNGVLRDQSEIDYDGLIKILPNAQITDSYLASHTLLLSDECRANAVPSLEIEAHEVKCSHEATVAPIDEEQLFYMASRGIRHAQACELITKGFLLPPIETLPDSKIKHMLREQLEQMVRMQ